AESAMTWSPLRRVAVALPVLIVALCVSGLSQEAPRVQILSPEPGSALLGSTLLKASVDPPESASIVAFFIDGRQVCEMTEAPFECEWDAGTEVSAHQTRLVVAPVSGPRVIKVLRTKSL